ncbi:MAG: hypothetical protein ACJAYB_003265 [Psychromonas sp.]|jgi:hypothetical protein
MTDFYKIPTITDYTLNQFIVYLAYSFINFHVNLSIFYIHEYAFSEKYALIPVNLIISKRMLKSDGGEE